MVGGRARERLRTTNDGMDVPETCAVRGWPAGERGVLGDNFNRAGRELDAQLARMGGERLARRCDGDESGGRMEAQFEEWGDKLVQRLSSSQGRSVKDKDEGSMSILDAKEDSAEAEDSYESDVEGEPSIAGSEDDQDMEDIADEHGGEKKEMVTDALRGALTKQGYKILGSHSGVKLCRWTKAMLRGRGGCYKHILWYRKSSMHGNHTIIGVCE